MSRQLELGGLPGFSGGPQTTPPAGITVRGDEIVAVSPEGQVRSMKLAELVERVAPSRIDTRGTVLPDGVKCVIPVPRGTIFVHQTPPRVHSLRWIADDSPRPFGRGTSYREVSLALPYVIVLAVFDDGPTGLPHLGGSSECFFSNRPLDQDGVETKLCYPALLNCSSLPQEDPSRPLSWICVQHLPELGGSRTAGAAVRNGLGALLRHLLESGFNLSSEHHEGSSWYSETVKAAVDPRVASIEAWEEASREDRLFALEVPWLPTNRTLAQIAQRIADARGRGAPRLRTERDLMRMLHRPTRKTTRKETPSE